MMTHAGSWPVDTGLNLLSPLSTQKTDLAHATKSFIPSSQTSSVGSELPRSAMSRSSSTSSSTSMALLGENPPDHSTTRSRAVSVTEQSGIASQQLIIPTKEVSTNPIAGKSFTNSDQTEITEFRTSQRVRKPTSKAQALLGSNLFRSFSKSRHSNDRSETPEQPEKNEDLQKEKEQSVSIAVQHDQLPPAPEELVTDDSELISVSPLTTFDNEVKLSTSPPRRYSTRDRKPAAKLIEANEFHEPKRRKLGEGTPEPREVKKVKLSITPSKLREYMIANITEKNEQLPVESLPVGESRSHSEDISQIANPETETSEKPKSCCVVLKLPSRMLAQVEQTLKVGDAPIVGAEAVQTQNDASTQNEIDTGLETQVTEAHCDLSCLSPSSVLLAFSKIAVDWSDSDNEEEPGTAQGDEVFRLKKSLSQFCRCHRSPTTSPVSQIEELAKSSENSSAKAVSAQDMA